MPEYLAPGVYIEETSFRSKSIEGVSTTTTGFIGPTRYGPLDLEPDIITSLGEFERIYGDRQQLVYQRCRHAAQLHVACGARVLRRGRQAFVHCACVQTRPEQRRPCVCQDPCSSS